MVLFPEEDKSKLAPSNHSKSLPELIRNACAQCRGSCLTTPSTVSSADESLDSDLDHKQLIILEIQSRAMQARPSQPKEELFSGMLAWAMSPTTGRVHITPIRKIGEEEECDHSEEEEDDDDDDSEAFFSAGSCFSCCTTFSGRSRLDEFGDCEGWPFGLCRRAVVLPPLPSSPSDSWLWHKRNLARQ